MLNAQPAALAVRALGPGRRALGRLSGLRPDGELLRAAQLRLPPLLAGELRDFAVRESSASPRERPRRRPLLLRDEDLRERDGAGVREGAVPRLPRPGVLREAGGAARVLFRAGGRAFRAFCGEFSKCSELAQFLIIRRKRRQKLRKRL